MYVCITNCKNSCKAATTKFKEFSVYIMALWLMRSHILGVSHPLPTCKAPQNFWFSVKTELLI